MSDEWEAVNDNGMGRCRNRFVDDLRTRLPMGGGGDRLWDDM